MNDTANASHTRLLWALIVVPIGAWIAHLTFSAAFVPFTGDHPEYRWTLYAITVVTGAPVLVTIAVSLWLARRNRSGTAEGGSFADQTALLAVLGIAFGVINLVLIIAEGIVVPFLSSRA
jgi:hypothetical protein